MTRSFMFAGPGIILLLKPAVPKAMRGTPPNPQERRYGRLLETIASRTAAEHCGEMLASISAHS